MMQSPTDNLPPLRNHNHPHQSRWTTTRSRPCPELDRPFIFLRVICHTIGNRAHEVRCLVDLLLLVDAELARAAVDEQQKTANDGQDLEEVVLGEILVRVVLVELNLTWLANRSLPISH